LAGKYSAEEGASTCSPCAAGKPPPRLTPPPTTPSAFHPNARVSSPTSAPAPRTAPHAGRSGGGQHRVLENRRLGPEGQVASHMGERRLLAHGGLGALASDGGVSVWEVWSIARGHGGRRGVGRGIGRSRTRLGCLAGAGMVWKQACACRHGASATHARTHARTRTRAPAAIDMAGLAGRGASQWSVGCDCICRWQIEWQPRLLRAGCK